MKIEDYGKHYFHDSILCDIQISNKLDEIILEIQLHNEERKKIICNNILHFEYETVSTGTKQNNPIDIYELYTTMESNEYNRWKDRLKLLEYEKPVYHLVCASSIYCGWGANDSQDGLSIICCDYKIS